MAGIYQTDRDAYIAYLKTFVPWIGIRTLALIAYKPSEFSGVGEPQTQTVFQRSDAGQSTSRNPGLGRLLVFKSEPLWREKSVPKKSGGRRVLHVPNVLLKQLQRATLKYLESSRLLPTSESAVAFRRGQSVRANAAIHAGSQTVIRLDVKEFFPSITADCLSSLLRRGGLHPRIAALIAALVTHKGRLPQGAPSSPALSNAVCLPLDRTLEAFATKHRLRYSRYADDIVMSARRKLTLQEVRDSVWKVRLTAATYGFRLNLRKTRVMHKHHRQMVTGVVVNARPRPPREYRKYVRALVHNVSVNGFLAEAQKFVRKQGHQTERVGRTPHAAWRAMQARPRNKAAIQRFTKQLERRRRIGRHADYEQLERFIPEPLRRELERVTTDDRFAVIDFWLHANGLLGYLQQFEPAVAQRQRAALVQSHFGTPQRVVSLPARVREIEGKWAEVQAARQRAREIIHARRGWKVFHPPDAPRRSERQVVAKGALLFEQFVIVLWKLVGEKWDKDVWEQLPVRLRSGFHKDLSDLRNCFAHGRPGDEGKHQKKERRRAEVFGQYVQSPELPEVSDSYFRFQLALISDATSWLDELSAYFLGE